MDHAAALEIIRACFAHVEVERIFIEHEPLIGREVARVVVRSDQFDEALRDNGAHAQQAAMKSGVDIEVIPSSK